MSVEPKMTLRQLHRKLLLPMAALLLVYLIYIDMRHQKEPLRKLSGETTGYCKPILYFVPLA